MSSKKQTPDAPTEIADEDLEQVEGGHAKWVEIQSVSQRVYPRGSASTERTAIGGLEGGGDTSSRTKG